MTTTGAVRPGWPGLIEAYRDRLPVTAATPVVTLHEGGTPLVHSPLLSERTGCEVHLKVEGANPTGSSGTWRIWPPATTSSTTRSA